MQKPRALPRTSLGASQFRVQMTPIFSFTNCFSILGRWDYVRLAQRLFKSTRVRLRNEIVFWQVSYVCKLERNLTSPKKPTKKKCTCRRSSFEEFIESQVEIGGPRKAAQQKPRKLTASDIRVESTATKRSVALRSVRRHSKSAAFPYYPGLINEIVPCFATTKFLCR